MLQEVPSGLEDLESRQDQHRKMLIRTQEEVELVLGDRTLMSALPESTAHLIVGQGPQLPKVLDSDNVHKQASPNFI